MGVGVTIPLKWALCTVKTNSYVSRATWWCDMAKVLFSYGVVAVAGSRSLSVQGAGLVSNVSRQLVANGCSLVVGCCVGVDQAVVSSGLQVSTVRVLSAFGPGGQGAGPASAVVPVLAFAHAGGSVSWWCGGGASVPLVVRLHKRTRAVVGAADAGLVAVFSSPSSRGTQLACRTAVARGLPVVAFPLGFPGHLLPSLGTGSWAPSSAGGVWCGAWCWVSGQGSLF
jgi:hypothetical protein